MCVVCTVYVHDVVKVSDFGCFIGVSCYGDPEPVYVEVSVMNRLLIPLQLTNVTLIWKLEPELPGTVSAYVWVDKWRLHVDLEWGATVPTHSYAAVPAHLCCSL